MGSVEAMLAMSTWVIEGQAGPVSLAAPFRLEKITLLPA